LSYTKISKYMSLILRHAPESIGISLDEHGWAKVRELIDGISRTQPLTMEMLEEIVATDAKTRYSFNEDKTLIRANQGHSIQVDLELEEKTPPEYLYHGTGERFVESIKKQGLLPQSRQYVHLSEAFMTAVSVGKRHGKPFVFTVEAGKMREAGYAFFQSVNGVWLTEAVPREYLIP